MAAVTPIETPDSPELREFYDRIEGTSQGMGVLNVFKTMAHTPDLMRSWCGMMAVLLGSLKLEPTLRELAILRLFQVKRSDYGFAHHVRIAKLIGVSDEQIAALSSHADSDLFSDLQKEVLTYTDAVTRLEDGSKALATRPQGASLRAGAGGANVRHRELEPDGALAAAARNRTRGAGEGVPAGGLVGHMVTLSSPKADEESLLRRLHARVLCVHHGQSQQDAIRRHDEQPGTTRV